MFVNGVNDILGGGADFNALLDFRPLDVALGWEFGVGLLFSGVALSGLLGRALLSGLLRTDGILDGPVCASTAIRSSAPFTLASIALAWA